MSCRQFKVVNYMCNWNPQRREKMEGWKKYLKNDG